MVKGLDKQVYIYSLDTSSFYTDEENQIHLQLLKAFRVKNKIKKRRSQLNEKLTTVSEEDVIKKLSNKRKQNQIRNKRVTKKISDLKDGLNLLHKNFTGVRELRTDAITDTKKIGMFDSALTRTIGMKVNTVSDDLFVVRVYYFRVLKDLIEKGFIHNGEKYIYFSSSAGQIRTKKAVFIRESLWVQHEGALTCGLTIDEINKKGGINVNKLLAYKALTASASEKWYGFDIKRTIVVPDLETNVTSLFDNINRDTYEINREELSVPIEHTDGCGMILPRKSKKSFMVRLPFVKGLLVPFPFDKFAEEAKNTKITDIYGKVWDVIDDRVEVIFTASQFKMKKYYDGWEDYQNRFIKYKSQAVKLNEEDIGEDANLTYQMLQTLTDFKTAELKQIANNTIKDITKIGSDKETMLRVLGATKGSPKRNHYQEALLLYPELLNDNHSKKIIKDKKKSMINDARSGKIRINGKYTYLIPDLYAFCEKLFTDKVPNGLIKNGEVFCRIFEEKKVDILRSPHLYKEHCVRSNNLSPQGREWFVTDGIYTSIHDPISRILQFDNDGDKALVVQDDLFTEVAERNMDDVVPLYYEMMNGAPEQITDTKIYDSLLLAFKANIGEISNNITKVFNSNKDIEIDVVKWLTMENNFEIDYAKTLYKPSRPETVDEKIRSYIKDKVPYFFREAKDKEIDKVEPLNNSTVNRLRKVIPNKKIKFQDVAGEFDYRNLMSEEVIHVNTKVIKEYRKIERSKKAIMRRQGNINKRDALPYIYKYIKDRISEIEPDVNKVVNVLVEELYGRTDAPVKTTLWECYGDILLNNLKINIKDTVQCAICGVRIEISNNKSKYCKRCSKEEWKKYNALKQKEYRRKNRV